MDIKDAHRLGDHADHPRPRRGRRHGRQGDGDVRRPPGRVGTADEVFYETRAPVHARAAGVAAPRRRPRRRAAEPDPRPAAVADQPAARAAPFHPRCRLRRRTACRDAVPPLRRRSATATSRRADCARGRSSRSTSADAACPAGERDGRADRRDRARRDRRRREPTPAARGRATWSRSSRSAAAVLAPRRRPRCRRCRGVSFDVDAQRDARPGGRVGLRQVDHRPAAAAPASRPTSGTVRVRGQRPRHASKRKELRPLRQRLPDRLPGPVRLAQPPHDGRATRSAEPLKVHHGMRQGRGRRPGRRAARDWSACRPSTPAATPTSSPAASASGSASPGPWPSTRR